jgi:hypothetical protein
LKHQISEVASQQYRWDKFAGYAHGFCERTLLALCFFLPVALGDRQTQRMKPMDEIENNEESTTEIADEANLDVESPPVEPLAEDEVADDTHDEENDPSDSQERTRDDQGLYRPYLGNDLTTQRLINMQQWGTVVLHYPHRDVRVPIDGDSALRLLTMFRDRTDKHWQDELNPHRSSAKSGWLVLDLNELLCISWLPSTEPGPRTAIDPK